MHNEMISMGYAVTAHKDLKVGQVVPENDGFLLNVVGVEVHSTTQMAITYQSDFSSHSSFQDGNTVIVKNDDLVYAKFSD